MNGRNFKSAVTEGFGWLAAADRSRGQRGPGIRAGAVHRRMMALRGWSDPVHEIVLNKGKAIGLN